jgi:hypothetical protein
MTVKELASKMNELMRNGCPDHFVFLSYDNQISFPVVDIYRPKLTNMVIITGLSLDSKKEDSSS